MKPQRAWQKSSVIVACFLLGACGAPEPSAPGTVTYSQVQQIFNGRCAGGACHVDTEEPGIFGGSLDLSAGQAAPCLINVASEQDRRRVLIKPGDAAASYLLCKVDPSCPSISGTWMPIASPLSADEMAILKAWVLQGAKGGATGTCGNSSSGTGGGTGAPDTTPPNFAGATGATGGSNSVNITWTAATDDVTPQNQLVYRIYQAAAAGGESFTTPMYTSAAGARSYNVGKLAPSTKYYFVVRAEDQAGNIDTNNVEVSATTSATADTTAPTFAGLTSARASGTSIALSWSAASDNVTPASQITYLIYQAGSAGGEKYTLPTYTTPFGATSYTVTGLSPGSTYYFVVRAEDAAGNIDTNQLEASAAISATPSFSGQVQPIFAANCAGGSCHSGTKPAQGLNLSAASTAYSALVNVASKQCPTTKLVLPSQPAMSYLVSKLQGGGPCFGGSQMPPRGPLSAANINLITGWISAGALNN